MIGTLIESQAQVQQHSLGSVVSVAVHAIIASAVIATAARSASITKPTPFEIFHIASPTPPPPAHERPASTAATQTRVAGVPQVPSISVPMIIPTQIPTVDLTVIPTAGDFIDRRSRSEPCAFQCGTSSADSTLPVWAANEAMMQLREPPVAPRYPDALRRAGVDGTVVVKFVVDTLGRVDIATVEVLSSSHDLFTAAVRETLAKLRFNPARVGGRTVRATAEMPFHFVLR